MTKKLLIGLVALLAVSLSAKADDIVGTYVGTLNVSLTNTNVENTEIFVEKDGDNYKLSVKDFEFSGEIIGDLDVAGIVRSEEAGIVVLTKEGSSPGPVVELAGTELNTFIYFTSATIDEGELELEMKVNGKNPAAEGDETPITNVTFTGQKNASGIFEVKYNSFDVYCTGGVIFAETGAESVDYVIYGQSGVAVQSGVVANGQINVDNLPSGAYILSVNGKAAKFIK